MMLQKKPDIDVLFLATLKKIFTEKEIFDIMVILTSEEIDESSIEVVEYFFEKLSARVGSVWTAVIELSKAFNLDILTMVPVLKKTDVWKKIKSSIDKESNSESFNEFF